MESEATAIERSKRLKFVKMHGTGNDFVVVSAHGEEYGWPGLARAICDRHFGVGSDGLVLALPSNQAAVRMRMFNPDGSEAEMCGNGIRCLAKFVIEDGLAATSGEILAVETLAGVLSCEVRGDKGRVDQVRVAMGTPRFRPAEVPVDALGDGPVQDLTIKAADEGFSVTCVSMGNPHAVHFTNRPVNEFPLASVGPEVEHSKLFPNRVNFEIVNPLTAGRVRARVWERGAGETLACGTGACAIGVAARLAGLSDTSTLVSLPGGELKIDWDGHGEVFLSGPAVEVFRGEWLGSTYAVDAGATAGVA
jgi:diaminopimelate epimerase